MSYTMYTPLNVWLDPASVTDVVAYIQTYLSENTIYSETEIETIIHDYLIAHPELIGGVQSVNGKTGTVVLSASDINTENNVTIESVLASLSSQISSIAASVATNTSNITGLTGRMTTAETDLANLKSNITNLKSQNLFDINGDFTTINGATYEINDNILTVKSQRANSRIQYQALDVSGINTLTIFFKGRYEQGVTGSCRIRVRNGSDTAWMGYALSNTITKFDVTNESVVYISFYGNSASTAYESILSSSFEDVTILDGSYTLIPANTSTSKDIVARGTYNKSFISIAHKGGGENKRSAIIQSCKRAFTYLEVDVKFTSDNVPVLIHEDSYTAESGVFKNNGVPIAVTINETPYETLKTYTYYDEEIATLEWALEIIKYYGKNVVLDKCIYFTETQWNIVFNLVRIHSADSFTRYTVNTDTYSRVLTNNSRAKLSFNFVVANIINGLFSNTCQSILSEYPLADIWEAVQYTNVDSSNINELLLNIPPQVKFLVYTINNQVLYMNYVKNVAGIYSDTIALGDLIEF